MSLIRTETRTIPYLCPEQHMGCSDRSHRTSGMRITYPICAVDPAHASQHAGQAVKDGDGSNDDSNPSVTSGCGSILHWSRSPSNTFARLQCDCDRWAQSLHVLLCTGTVTRPPNFELPCHDHISCPLRHSSDFESMPANSIARGIQFDRT